MTRPPPLFADPPVVMGHRGAPRLQRENTPASFAAAAAAGAGWVEMDARLDADGRVVVHHDPVLPDGRALIHLRAEECEAAGVSTLQQVLIGLPSRMGVDLEIKNVPGEADHDEALQVVDACAEVLAAAAASSPVQRPAMISSFNPLVLMAAAERGLPQPLGLLTIGLQLAAGIEAATELGCSVICPHHATGGLDGPGVQAAHDAGLAVLVWTVNEPAHATDLAAAGVDAICTDDPAGIRQVVRG